MTKFIDRLAMLLDHRKLVYIRQEVANLDQKQPDAEIIRNRLQTILRNTIARGDVEVVAALYFSLPEWFKIGFDANVTNILQQQRLGINTSKNHLSLVEAKVLEDLSAMNAEDLLDLVNETIREQNPDKFEKLITIIIAKNNRGLDTPDICYDFIQEKANYLINNPSFPNRLWKDIFSMVDEETAIQMLESLEKTSRTAFAQSTEGISIFCACHYFEPDRRKLGKALYDSATSDLTLSQQDFVNRSVQYIRDELIIDASSIEEDLLESYRLKFLVSYGSAKSIKSTNPTDETLSSFLFSNIGLEAFQNAVLDNKVETVEFILDSIIPEDREDLIHDVLESMSINFDEDEDLSHMLKIMMDSLSTTQQHNLSKLDAYIETITNMVMRGKNQSVTLATKYWPNQKIAALLQKVEEVLLDEEDFWDIREDLDQRPSDFWNEFKKTILQNQTTQTITHQTVEMDSILTARTASEAELPTPRNTTIPRIENTTNLPRQNSR